MFPKTLVLCGVMGLVPHFVKAMPTFSWDFQTYYAHAEALPSSLTTQQIASINQFDGYYPTGMINPNGAGLTTAEFDEVQAMPAYFGLSRDPISGVLTGRGIVVDDEGAGAQPNLSAPASFNGDFVTKVTRLTDLYARASTGQAPVLEQIYSDLIEHYLDQGYLPGGPNPWMGNGYIWRDRGWKTLRMVHKLSADKRDLYALSIAHISGFGGLEQDHASASTDTYHTYLATANRSLALVSDTPGKWQYMKLIRRGLDISIIGKEGNPKGQLVPLDGSVIHHDGHHVHYAGYSYAGMLITHNNWTAAGFSSSYTPQAIERLRKGSLAWCFATTGGLNPAHQLMRSGLSSRSSLGDGGAGGGLDFAIRAATLTSTYYGTPIDNDLEMAYAAIGKAGVGSTSLPVAWRSITPPANPDRNSPLYTASLLGHYSHTTNGTTIHRGPGQWYASIRSQHGHWRGGEAYDDMGLPDHFNVMSMRNALMLITSGKDGRKPNEVDSGFSYDGWDYSYYPNVTCPDYSPGSFLYWRKPAYFGGDSSLMGSANLRESGLWMSLSGTRKSAFFLGNRIVLSTSDVNGAGLHTGLIQYSHTTPDSEPLVVNGSSRTQNGDWILPAGGNHKIVDPQGNGYFIHPNANTPEMKIRRGLQKWIYPFASLYLGSGSAPAFTYASDFLARMNEFAPTTSTFSKVWFDHGNGAVNQSMEYTVLVKPQPGDLDAYASAMENPTTAPVVISRNSNIHHYYDRATETYAAAVFDPAEAVNREGLLGVNRGGAYIWRRDGDLLHLSMSSSDVWNTTPFQVTMAGTWTVESSEDTYSVSATASGANTIVSLSMRQAAPQRVVLRRVSGSEWESLTSTVDVGSNHTQYSLNLNSAGIGTSPVYTVVSDGSAGLFAVQGSNLVATRSFVPGDAGEKILTVQATQGGNMLGTIVIKVKVTDTTLAALALDSDGDGFRDAFETSSGTNPNSASSKPSTSLVAYWNFDQTQTPYDVVGGIVGSFRNGATCTTDGAGHGGGSGNRALDLGSGGAAYMAASELANINRATSANRLTISYWQKLDTLANNFAFYGVSPSSASQRGLSAHAPHSSTIYFDAGGANAENRISVAQPGGHNWQQWVHVALVRDGGTAQIWLNGTLLKTETGKTALKSDLTQWIIGSGINGELGLLGEMDDFAIFSAPLNATQISALAAGASPLALNAPANQAPIIATSALSIAENSPGGSAIGTVSATDSDGPGAMTYSIYGNALSDVFTINASTGTISTVANAVLNYESRNSYPLIIVVRDSAGAVTTKEITIAVTDVNEAPVAQGFVASLFDTIPVGTVIGTVTSTDEDAAQSRIWSIGGGNDSGAFSVNATTGEITVAQPLNGAAIPSYNLTLTSTDSGGLSGSDQVVLSVFGMQGITTDSDGDGFSDSFEIARGSNPNSTASVPNTILAAYWNFDQAGTPATFSDLVRTLQGQPISGVILSSPGTGRTGAVNDRAADFGNSGTGPRVEVNTIAWLNQLAASDKITISFWQKYNSRTGYASPFYGVSPSSAAGQRGLSAHSPWSDNIVYLDHGGTAATNRTSYGPVGYWRDLWHHTAFVKNGGTVQIWINGQLLTTQSGKAALKTDFTKLILGADLSGNSAVRGLMDDVAVFSKALSASQITALNAGASPLAIDMIENNLPPTILTESLSFPEDAGGSSAVGTVMANDPDGPPPITWALSGGNGLFAIDPATGVITTTASASFDRETTASYTVTVTATDAYEKVGSRQIIINVGNVNEAPVAQGFTSQLVDHTTVGTALGTATVTDPDVGDTHTWSITSGNPGNAFAINPATGEVAVAQPLDGTVTPYYTLIVTATDAGGETSDATVKVAVFGMNAITTDSDGDGYSDSFEISRFTDPGNAGSKPTSMLTAYWNFDQAGTPSTYSDLVRGLQGTPLSGATLSAGGAGRTGTANDRAADFGATGSGQRIEVSTIAWLNQLAASDKLTISVWQKYDSRTGYGVPFYGVSPSSGANSRGISAHTTSNDNIVYFDQGGSAAVNRVNYGPVGFWRDLWFHVALVKNVGTMQIWVNGQLLVSQSGKAALKTDFTKLILGGELGGWGTIRGKLDDFAVFNNALSSSQITALAAGVSPLALDPVNLPPNLATTSFDLAENAAGSTVVGDLGLNDADGPAPVSCSLSGTSLFTLDPATGVLSTASGASFNYEAQSSHTMTVTTLDDGGARKVHTVTVNITNVNEAPAFTSDPIVGSGVTEGNAYSGNISGTAADVDTGDVLTYSKVSGPAWLTVASNGALSGMPGVGAAGSNSFTVRVTDAAGASDDAVLTIQVTKPAGTGDADGDGFTNAFEEAAGSDPYSNASTPSGVYSGLQAWWRLDEASGTSADDATGRPQDGVLIGSPAWTSGLTGNAITFNGSNQSVQVPSVSLSSNTVTLTVWVKRNGTQSVWSGMVFDRGNGASGLGFGTNHELRYTWNNTSNTYNFNSGLTVPDNTWTFCAVVVEATKATLYMQPAGGTMQSAVNTVTHATHTFSSSTYLGQDSQGSRFFKGALDDVRVHSRALSAAEIGQLASQYALPLPWANATVGTGALAGGSLFSNGKYTVSGSGVLGGTADQANYAYQTLSGDGEIVAKIATLHNTGTSAAVGVVVRDSLAAGAPHVFVGSDGAGTYKWSSRSAAGGSTTSNTGSAGTSGSQWVKIVRSGDTFTVSTSADGSTWSVLGTTNVTMATNCYMGLSVSSGSATTINTSQFSAVSATP